MIFIELQIKTNQGIDVAESTYSSGFRFYSKDFVHELFEIIILQGIAHSLDINDKKQRINLYISWIIVEIAESSNENFVSEETQEFSSNLQPSIIFLK